MRFASESFSVASKKCNQGNIPLILIFYFIDVAQTAIRTRSVKPVGDFVMKIWEFALSAWDKVVHFGELVWDAITFWS